MLAPIPVRAYIQGMSRSFADERPLDPRARHLLRTLIGRYIRDGEPVGSQTLSRHAGLDVSPATIRNILADLEDAGLLSSPHTSAGRIPTAQGYRVFVDSLLQLRPLPEGELARLRQELPAGSGTQSLLGNASELLSAMSHFVGVVSVPRREQFAFRHIDFVPLDAQRVLAILVFADNDVQNRIIQTRRAYDAGELERVSNYLNHNFAGRPLSQIRAALVRELKAARSEMDGLLAHTVELAEQALVGGGDDMLLAGQTRLMGVQDLSDLDRLRELFEAFARKREILQLLERTLRAPGVRIFIGEETGLAPLEGMSLVTAPYRAGGAADGQVLGVLGVIGPSRMAYERVIPGGSGGGRRARRGARRALSTPTNACIGGPDRRLCLESTARAPISGVQGGMGAADGPWMMTTEPMQDADVAQASDDSALDQADQIEALKGELEQLRAEALRERADLDNQRKRLTRDIEMARKFANERLLSELLPLFDSLEAGLLVAPAADPLREGMELTLRQLHRIAENNGLSEVAPTPGTAFDPERHQAMSMVAGAGRPARHRSPSCSRRATC